ncbi:MAG: molybdenum cofactor guanylyltransferase [Ferruginibacter sp.]
MTATLSRKNDPVTNTYGLVVCGGHSRRMGTDKSMLRYHQKPQRYHVYDMLLPFCEKVYISCNDTQANTNEPGYNFIKDDPAFSHTGPMAALLTAFNKFPQRNILFIGCDYPFLSIAELQNFLYSCGNELSGFYNDEAAVYDPLLAFYPAASAEPLNRMHEAKQFSLQHFLKEQRAVKHFPLNKKSMISIDTEEEFLKAKDSISRS